ncbi:MAG: NUDIX hydrolase [Bacteroidota bacterium]
MKRWRQLSTEIVYQNPWWTYKRDRFQIPDGPAGTYHYVYTRGSAMMVPVDAEGRLVVVRQYRYLADRFSIEFPCGSIEEGKTSEEMADVELRQEAQVRAGTLRKVGQFNPYNGVTCEMCDVYLATDLEPAPLEADATEEFEILRLTPTELDAAIADGSLWDGMTIASWAIARGHVVRGL